MESERGRVGRAGIRTCSIRAGRFCSSRGVVPRNGPDFIGTTVNGRNGIPRNCRNGTRTEPERPLHTPCPLQTVGTGPERPLHTTVYSSSESSRGELPPSPEPAAAAPAAPRLRGPASTRVKRRRSSGPQFLRVRNRLAGAGPLGTAVATMGRSGGSERARRVGTERNGTK